MAKTETLALKGDKNKVLGEVEAHLRDQGFNMVAKDFNRPWGGFFVLDETQAEKFGKTFFPDINIDSLKVQGGKLSPKILMVESNKRLSWQYHHRRSEIWKLVAGTAGVVMSPTDQQGALKRLVAGEVIRLEKGMRHRLVGLDGWGMIAEIWQHTDPSNPSNEDDIVRVQDDFGR
ncbi:MAG TPA: phosphoheptose isomerase [Chryseosolibacter sp.]|nr:phosphoheptose isomerase [Chryseosolibacter sp.]